MSVPSSPESAVFLVAGLPQDDADNSFTFGICGMHRLWQEISYVPLLRWNLHRPADQGLWGRQTSRLLFAACWDPGM